MESGLVKSKFLDQCGQEEKKNQSSGWPRSNTLITFKLDLPVAFKLYYSTPFHFHMISNSNTVQYIWSQWQ